MFKGGSRIKSRSGGILGEVLWLARRVLGRGIAFLATIEILSFVLLSPLITWSLYRALAVSGQTVWMNFDLLDLLMSPRVILPLLWIPVLTVVALLTFGGLSLQVSAARRGSTLSILETVRQIVLRLHLLRGLSVLRAGLYLVVVLPGLGLIATALVTGGFLAFPRSAVFEIVPTSPALLATLGAGIVISTVLAIWLTMRWLFVVPLVCAEGLPLGSAFRQSIQLGRGRRGEILKWVALSLLGIALVLALMTAALSGLSSLVLHWSFGAGEKVFMLAASLLVVANGAVLSVLGWTALIWIVSLNSVLYARARGEEVPKTSDSGGVGFPARWGTRAWLGLSAAALAIAIGFTVPSVARQIHELDRSFEITAHRGSAVRAPENTIAAVSAALEDRADWIEIDVQQTSDGGIVLLHDLTLARTTGRPEGAWQLTTDQITSIDAGAWFGASYAGETIPTLRAVIDTIGGRARLNIEVKLHGRERNLARSLVEVIHETGIGDTCAVTSLDARFLAEIRRLDPMIQLGIIVSASIGDLLSLDVDMLVVQPLIASPEFIARAHRRGRGVHVWSLSEPRHISTVIDRGADGVLTPNPALARQVLEVRTPADNMRALMVRLLGFSRGAAPAPEGWE